MLEHEEDDVGQQLQRRVELGTAKVGTRVRASAGAGVFPRSRSDGLFEVDGRGLGLSSALPHWLCRCWPENGGDGFEHAGVRAG